MANDFPYVYPYFREEAKRLNQLPLWRDSHKENVACKDAIEEAIRRDFDGMYLDKDAYTDSNSKFAVDSHPAVLDGFVNQYRRAYQSLALFDHTHCLPDTEKQDFVGKVVVLSPKALKESCLTAQDQLWLCTGGFGAHAGARGRAVFATNLADGEKTRWDRTDFVGVLADSHLPDWAIEKLSEMQEQESSAMGGMQMK
jgi:hypothetical protein